MHLSFVSIQLTCKCNLDCGICFRRLGLEEADTKNIFNLISKIAEFNVDMIVLSGGEPLLRKDLLDIIKFIKDKGMKVALQSNGILLSNQLDNLVGLVDVISLSLDGPNEKVNSIFRGPGHLAAIVDVLPKIKEKNIKVKLGTVITKINYKDVSAIGNLIINYVDVWKLYQFFPRVNTLAQKNKKIFEISDLLYNKTVKNTKLKNPKINIISHSKQDFNNSPCIMIDPNGDAFISDNCADIFIGNFLKDKKLEIEKKINSYSSINTNFNKTYKL